MPQWNHTIITYRYIHTLTQQTLIIRTLCSALDSSGSCNGALSPPPTTPNPTSAVCPPDDSLAAAGQHFLPGPLCAEPTLVLHQAYTNDSSFKWLQATGLIVPCAPATCQPTAGPHSLIPAVRWLLVLSDGTLKSASFKDTHGMQERQA